VRFLIPDVGDAGLRREGYLSVVSIAAVCFAEIVLTSCKQMKRFTTAQVAMMLRLKSGVIQKHTLFNVIKSIWYTFHNSTVGLLFIYLT